MAGLAAGLVVLIEVFVHFVIPPSVGDIVQAVGTARRPWQTAGGMASLAPDDGP